MSTERIFTTKSVCLHALFPDFENNTGVKRASMIEDQKMVDTITKTMSRRFVPPAITGPTTMNLVARKNELKRISNSNLKLLNRIEGAKSEYSFQKHNSDYMKSQKYALNASFSLRKKCENIVRQVNSTKRST